VVSIPIRSFWWRDINFGDRLTQFLLSSYGYSPSYSAAATADVVAVGSILQMVPSSFSGVVLGSGFLWEQNRIQFPTARIVGVRGRLTAERCGAPPFCILSDPGLLLGRWAPSDRQIKWV